MKFEDVLKMDEYNGEVFNVYIVNKTVLTDFEYWLFSKATEFDLNNFVLDFNNRIELYKEQKDQLKLLKRELKNKIQNFNNKFDNLIHSNSKTYFQLSYFLSGIEGHIEGHIDYYLEDMALDNKQAESIDYSLVYNGNIKSLALFFKKLSETYNADNTPVLKIDSKKQLAKAISTFFKLNEGTVNQYLERKDIDEQSSKMRPFDMNPFKKNS